MLKRRNRESRVSGSALSKARLRQWIVSPFRKGGVSVQLRGRATFNCYGWRRQVGRLENCNLPLGGSIPSASYQITHRQGNAPDRSVNRRFQNRNPLQSYSRQTEMYLIGRQLSREILRLPDLGLLRVTERQAESECSINQKAGYHFVITC